MPQQRQPLDGARGARDSFGFGPCPGGRRGAGAATVLAVALSAMAMVATVATSALGAEGGSSVRAGWEADIYRQPAILKVRGIATIVDERTIRLTHFHFAGPPANGVFGRLAMNNTPAAIDAGRRIGSEFIRAYTNDTVEVQLPEGETIDQYRCFSVYCEPVFLNLGSALFAPPERPQIEIQPQGGQELAIIVTGAPRRAYRIEATEELGPGALWQPILAEFTEDGFLAAIESATNRARYYRAVRD